MLTLSSKGFNSQVNSTQILLSYVSSSFIFISKIYIDDLVWRIQVEGGGYPGAENFFSPPSEEDRDDQRGPNGVELDGHVLQLHDGHGGGDGDYLHDPQGVILYYCLLKLSSLLAFRTSARVQNFLLFSFVYNTIDRFININCLTVEQLVFSFRQLIFINLSMCIINKTEQ